MVGRTVARITGWYLHAEGPDAYDAPKKRSSFSDTASAGTTTPKRERGTLVPDQARGVSNAFAAALANKRIVGLG